MFLPAHGPDFDKPADSYSLCEDKITINSIRAIAQQFQNTINQLQQENQKLKCENADLQCRVNQLENRQDELVNENQDLRVLVKRVYEEGEIQLQNLKNRLHLQQQKTKEANEQKLALQSSLRDLHENLEMYAQMKEWTL